MPVLALPWPHLLGGGVIYFTLNQMAPWLQLDVIRVDLTGAAVAVGGRRLQEASQQIYCRFGGLDGQIHAVI